MAQSQAVRKPEEGYDGGRLTTARAGNPTDWLVGWKSLFWGCALVMGANIFLWVWDYNFAFTAGLNSASREFTLYYRTLFWGELISLGIFTGIWYGWLIRTGRIRLATHPRIHADTCQRTQGERNGQPRDVPQLPRLYGQGRRHTVRAARRSGIPVHHELHRRPAGKRQDQLPAPAPLQRAH